MGTIIKNLKLEKTTKTNKAKRSYSSSLSNAIKKARLKITKDRKTETVEVNKTNDVRSFFLFRIFQSCL